MSEKRISRKEFLRKSSAAVLGAGLAAEAARLADAQGKSAPQAAKNAIAYRNATARKPLGRTGLSITPIGFGASRTMEPALVKRALDAGIAFYDTGPSYFNGMNETMVGKALAGRRKDVVIQSKLELVFRGDPAAGLGAADAKRIVQEMNRSLENSLKALGTDYIDIMLVHNATLPAITHHEAIRQFFSAAKKAGKIRAHGFSAHTNHVEMLQAAVREKFYEVVMVPYNHRGAYVHSNSGRRGEWRQEELEAELKKARDLGMGLVAMKTCSGGPCPPKGGGEPDFPSALRWIYDRGRVDGMAVAIANYRQLEDDLKALA
ncbi:MAG: aldo/keto reductase [Acidobacteriota bacterium]|jgi:aryl-alcohol dehydrogenase-like predicted oxidoreductase|nr:aldo/keto reductase [Acidobacteriota bacterium]